MASLRQLALIWIVSLLAVQVVMGSGCALPRSHHNENAKVGPEQDALVIIQKTTAIPLLLGDRILAKWGAFVLLAPTKKHCESPHNQGLSYRRALGALYLFSRNEEMLKRYQASETLNILELGSPMDIVEQLLGEGSVLNKSTKVYVDKLLQTLGARALLSREGQPSEGVAHDFSKWQPSKTAEPLKWQATSVVLRLLHGGEVSFCDVQEEQRIAFRKKGWLILQDPDLEKLPLDWAAQIYNLLPSWQGDRDISENVYLRWRSEEDAPEDLLEKQLEMVFRSDSDISYEVHGEDLLSLDRHMTWANCVTSNLLESPLLTTPTSPWMRVLEGSDMGATLADGIHTDESIVSWFTPLWRYSPYPAEPEDLQGSPIYGALENTDLSILQNMKIEDAKARVSLGETAFVNGEERFGFVDSHYPKEELYRTVEPRAVWHHSRRLFFGEKRASFVQLHKTRNDKRG